MSNQKEICKRYREKHKERFYKDQEKRRETVHGRLIVLLSSARTRAKQKNIFFDLTIDDLHALYIKQDGRCAITNLKMELKTNTRDKANNFCVSLDQIIPKGGYTIDNIQLVCLAVNRIKWNFSEEEFKFWLRIISSRVLSLEERFNDYPEMEYTSSEVEAPSSSLEDEDIV